MTGAKVLCGAPTRQGTACRWDKDECKHHGPNRGGQRREKRARAEPDRRRVAAILERRDVHEVAWWLIEQAMHNTLESPAATAASTALRVLASLGVDTADEAQLLRETEVRGLMMHGIPPRNDEEWEIAERLYPEATLAEVRRWPRSGEVDRSDGREPLGLGNFNADEPDVSGIVDDEH